VSTLELDEAMDGADAELEVRDRTDGGRWTDDAGQAVQVRGFAHPDLEILPRAKGGDGRTVTGILVPYGKAQEIRPGYREMFRKGAGAAQVRAASRVKFAREHLKFGGTLIGRATELRDDAAGMWVAFRAAPIPAGDEALTLVEEGVLDELSIGFRARQSKTHPDGTIERVKVDVLEGALVLEGAYGRGARVTGLRSQEGAQDGADTSGAEEVHEAAPEQQPAPGMSVAHARALQARRRIIIPAGMIR
jgi:HK97 family phage prohead protease